MIIGTGELETDLYRLKESNPQGYGYLKKYWDDAKRGLDGTDKNYARVTHIYENIPEPRIGTRGLGQTLVLLAQLNVISVLTNRSNATIYDLTTYRPDRLKQIGQHLNEK